MTDNDNVNFNINQIKDMPLSFQRSFVESIAYDMLSFVAEKYHVELRPKPTIRVFFSTNPITWQKCHRLMKYGVANKSENIVSQQDNSFQHFEKITAMIHSVKQTTNMYAELEKVKQGDQIHIYEHVVKGEELKRFKEAALWAIEEARGQDYLICFNLRGYRSFLKEKEKNVDSFTDAQVIFILLDPTLLSELIHEVIHILEYESNRQLIEHKPNDFDDASKQMFQEYMESGKFAQVARAAHSDGKSTIT